MLLRALDALPDLAKNQLPGVYIDIEGRPGEPLVTTSLQTSGLSLVKYEQGGEGNRGPSHAVVFASVGGLTKLRNKIAAFGEGEPVVRKGKVGRPPNANLVQSIGAIVEASLRQLWRGHPDKLPRGLGAVAWELWLDPNRALHFIEAASEHGVTVGNDRLLFPEDVVVIVMASPEALARAIKALGAVKGLALPSTTAEYYDSQPSSVQISEVDALLARVTYRATDASTAYVSILDTGTSLAHPLISPALAPGDRFAAELAWGLDDVRGHGTKIAGLSLFGDLTNALSSSTAIYINHRIEAVKIIPDAEGNPHHLLGAVTVKAVNAAETAGTRNRVFTLATTTADDTPHSGAPTSWSTSVDQLAAGSSGRTRQSRLFTVSAGNTDQNKFRAGNYLDVCDDPDHELEAPSQAWNAISIGAYTEKVVLEKGTLGSPVAPFGDLSPSSRTASWSSKWPIKPDVVLEGGNWLADKAPPPMRASDLMLLSTSRDYPLRVLETFDATSAATALASRGLAEIWGEYPGLWPETVRALFVSSARWTPQMRIHLPSHPSKSDYERLFRRYGYGVPDLERARKSASNALTLIIQDEIIPYRRDPKRTYNVHNQLKLFALPWPVTELRKLGITEVKLRVALSTFSEPNPSEPARGRKLSYGSHNLRFKLQRPNENLLQFVSRVDALTDDEATLEEALLLPETEDDGWEFGTQRRDVGSLQIDTLSAKASDLARRSYIAVHPVGGWWKTRKEDPSLKSARFSLIVELETAVEVDLYAEVETAIANLNRATNNIAVPVGAN